jgi:hypothetical protein
MEIERAESQLARSFAADVEECERYEIRPVASTGNGGRGEQ